MNTRNRLNLPSPRLNLSQLILVSSLGFTLFYNFAFFRGVHAVYGGSAGGLLFIGSLAVFLFAITLLLLSLMCHRYVVKPVLIMTILGAAAASNYMDSYNIVIDTTMLTNIARTDVHEVADLLSPQLAVQMLLLGIFPSLLVYRTRLDFAGFGTEIARRLQLIAVAFVLAAVAIAPFTSWYTGFFREHKILRYYSNPATFLYSGFSFARTAMAGTDSGVRASLGLDAGIPAEDVTRELIILVVGEAARADRFSLNGYGRETNPLLARENVISFSQVSSCATATAYSLPCMFSLSDRGDFSLSEANHQENVLDVLTHAGVNVLWRDNNSDSKGVAVAIPFEDYRGTDVNPVCDVECRDVGMLAGLPEFIASHPEGDIVIVMHQLGNHGPAYYKRYPAEFEKFTPVCRSIQLEDCTDAEIGNTYDNAILYTDYFLSQLIQFLKGYDSQFETAMYYMSDHGESLGENGLYLHGLPYVFAPEAQKHVASVMWFGSSYRIDRAALTARAQEPVSHDNYFHTVLGLMEIRAACYRADMDLVAAHTARGQFAVGWSR